MANNAICVNVLTETVRNLLPEEKDDDTEDYYGDILNDNDIGNLEDAIFESEWDAFSHRTFFFYFVAIGYFLVIAMQTMGTMFGDRNQLEVCVGGPDCGT